MAWLRADRTDTEAKRDNDIERCLSKVRTNGIRDRLTWDKITLLCASWVYLYLLGIFHFMLSVVSAAYLNTQLFHFKAGPQYRVDLSPKLIQCVSLKKWKTVSWREAFLKNMHDIKSFLLSLSCGSFIVTDLCKNQMRWNTTSLYLSRYCVSVL